MLFGKLTRLVCSESACYIKKTNMKGQFIINKKKKAEIPQTLKPAVAYLHHIIATYFSINFPFYNSFRVDAESSSVAGIKQCFIFVYAFFTPLIYAIYFLMSQLDLDYKRAGKFN